MCVMVIIVGVNWCHAAQRRMRKAERVRRRRTRKQGKAAQRTAAELQSRRRRALLMIN